ncbi:MAG: hypothetical protein WA894_08425, partial [Candidatus Acidiferrum sp.]
GFVTWTSPAITVGPGQIQYVPGSKLPLAGEAISATVYASSDQIAAEQVKVEERQRVFGIIPNFYVEYDHDAVPLTTKLKFKLALKASTDPVIFAAVAFTAGAEQAGDTPNYGQGAKGYGQRMGALYANGVTDVMVARPYFRHFYIRIPATSIKGQVQSSLEHFTHYRARSSVRETTEGGSQTTQTSEST